ncbi:MAG: SHOCT domain-containing protein [Phycisphaerae bacterium]
MTWFAIASGAILAAAFIGYFAIRFARARLRPQSRETAPAFTLADLRKMHADGHISDAEFEAMKAAIIGQARAAALGETPGPHSNGKRDG